MSINTRLFEVDPRSRVFELLRSNGELVEGLYLLSIRYEDPDFFEREREISDEYGGLLEAVDQMVGNEPDFSNRWIDLGKFPTALQASMEIIGEMSERSSLVRIIFEGEREFAPGRYVPACWIDTARCREIAEWLRSLDAAEIGAAAYELTRSCHGQPLPWSDEDEAMQKILYGKSRRLQALFAGAAERENVVAVLIQ